MATDQNWDHNACLAIVEEVGMGVSKVNKNDDKANSFFHTCLEDRDRSSGDPIISLADHWDGDTTTLA